jgi:hypothetical protein
MSAPTRAARPVRSGPARPVTGTTLLRLALGALGLSAAAFGAYQFYDRTHPDFGALLDLAIWLGSAVALHDGLFAPLVIVAGILLARSRLRPVQRSVLRGGLLTAGCLTLIALPMMLRPRPAANPTVLPLDYPVNWAIVLALTALATAAVAWALSRRGRSPEPEGPCETAGRPPGEG